MTTKKMPFLFYACLTLAAFCVFIALTSCSEERTIALDRGPPVYVDTTAAPATIEGQWETRCLGPSSDGDYLKVGFYYDENLKYKWLQKHFADEDCNYLDLDNTREFNGNYVIGEEVTGLTGVSEKLITETIGDETTSITFYEKFMLDEDTGYMYKTMKFPKSVEERDRLEVRYDVALVPVIEI